MTIIALRKQQSRPPQRPRWPTLAHDEGGNGPSVRREEPVLVARAVAGEETNGRRYW